MNQPENIVDKESVEKEPMPQMRLDYLVEVTDKNGKVIQRIAAPSRSFVRQWYEVMRTQAAQAGMTIKDTGGTDRGVGISINNLYAKAGIGVTIYGLRIGKGTTAVTISDYALESPIEEGTGLDQFEHQLTTITLPAVVGSTCSFTISRSMLNSSGATITGIKEIGCYMRMAAAYYGLGFRDVLPSAIYVPHGGAITVTYTIGVTV